MAWYSFRPYVPVAQRRAKALHEMDKLRKQGKVIEPVQIEGRAIARSFWGKAWCEHLESFSDFENRLPRGRTYARNGSVCHLAVQPERVEAIVCGSELYKLDIRIAKLEAEAWHTIKQRCAGQVGSMLELLQGKLSEQVMAVVADRNEGLFPQPREIDFDCSCPDFATMCKHVAAVLYGIGHRLDSQPELLFTLRGVDPQELIASEIQLPQADTTSSTLADDQLSDIFGIDLDDQMSEAASDNNAAAKPTRQPAGQRSATNGRPRSTNRPRAAHRTSPTTDPSRNGTPRKAPGTKSATSSTTNSARTSRTSKRTSAARRNATTASNASNNNLSTLRLTGNSIARLRKQADCSVADFAKQIGVTPATVYRWESTPNRLRLQPASHTAIARLHQQMHHT